MLAFLDCRVEDHSLQIGANESAYAGNHEMKPQLQVIAGPDKGRVFPLSDGQSLAIGRGETTGTQLRDARVSRVHCQVEVDAGKFELIHASTSGSTLVNGRAVTRHPLQPGDVIRVGDTELRFVLDAAEEADKTVVTSQPTAGSGKAPAASGSENDLTTLVGKSISHYEIQRVLAKGSTGEVFLARDTQGNQQVALKVLWPAISKDDEEMQRFVRAMKTMLPIRHPNLVTLYNAGRTGPYCWIAMEYVDGESLTQVIERIGTAGMLDWRNAFRVAVHVGRGLEEAHKHQIVHRNITPANILVRSSDKVTKLGDLMLAKALEGTLAVQVTRPGQLVGELAYMAPERTRTSDTIDGRSDIYGLGATVYALITGRPPFEGSSLPDLVTKIRQADPVKPKKFQLSVPDLFEGAVLRMLAKRPEERYQTPAELLAELERIAKFQGITV
jgi:pSer/pThr/pTyr-binding forkhead associated (FHA) protein